MSAPCSSFDSRAATIASLGARSYPVSRSGSTHSIALHSTGLIGVDMFVSHFPKAVQKGIDILFKIVMLVFLVVLVYFGFQYVMTGYKRLITTLNISYAYVTASVPVGALLMIISVGQNLYKSIKTPVEKWGEKA